ncbi:MAG TPA: surface-adhesin E family protein [Burkholderiales bacterium]|nr:surface-adhesin E family protein [Burkholderiales bacterium]
MVQRWLVGLALVAAAANATEWVEVGADTEARYYVDVDSISVDGENVSVQKRGIYTHVLTDNFGGHSATFKETIGTIELDCARRINRVTRIDMIGEDGQVVWSSGPMKKRMWEEVRTNSHAESTLQVVCRRLNRI